MADTNKILTAEEEQKLLEPIEAHINEIQKKIDALRVSGTDEVIARRNHIQLVREDKNISKDERPKLIEKDKAAIAKAAEIEKKNKPEVDRLIAEGEAYLKEHFDRDFFNKVKDSCAAAKAEAQKKNQALVNQITKEHQEALSKLTDKAEIKDENYVYKNKLFDAKMRLDSELQDIKSRQHDAFSIRYHYIDMLRLSRFTFAQNRAQKWENYKYNFNVKQFFLKNGLYIVIVLIFIMLGIITPIVKHTSLFTMNNILNILQQASPRMFLALGVAGLILLTGTDLSIGRMVGMGMVTATIIMHKGINTGAVFGHIFDFTLYDLLYIDRRLLHREVQDASVYFDNGEHADHLRPCYLRDKGRFVRYATKGVSFGAIESEIPGMIIPKINGFPTIILWAVAAICIVWFIWNKTTFGKNLYAVGGNPEAASVSGISVFAVTMGAFMAGILYGFGAWLECARMVGSGSAAYGQGWDMDAIAACVVGGVSFTGGIGKISGVVVGVLIFTSLTYSLTILGIDTNLQFVFEGIIILAAVTLDCLKYVQKK